MAPTPTPLTTSTRSNGRRPRSAVGGSGSGRRTLAIVEKELDEMKKENDSLRAEILSLKTAQVQAAAEAASDIIPRPKSSNYSIYVAMHMEDNEGDQKKYCSYQRTIRDTALHAGVDFNLSYRNQPSEKLARIFKAARQAQPDLARYENNWASAALLQQFITNRRKYMRLHGGLGPAAAAAPQPAPTPGPAPVPVPAVTAGGVAVPNINAVDGQGQGQGQGQDQVASDD